MLELSVTVYGLYILQLLGSDCVFWSFGIVEFIQVSLPVLVHG